jgi:hypothetical protein
MSLILKTGDAPAIASSRREFLATARRLVAAPLVAAAGVAMFPEKAQAASLVGAWNYYFNNGFRYRDCVCGYRYPAGNCAHSLSNALAVGGGYAGVLTAGYTDANCRATPRRPIRARDLRAWFALMQRNPLRNVCPAVGTGIYCVYENSAANDTGTGHVCMFNTTAGIYTWAGTGYWPSWPLQEFYKF